MLEFLLLLVAHLALALRAVAVHVLCVGRRGSGCIGFRCLPHGFFFLLLGTVFAVVAREVLHPSIAFEHEEVVHHFVHEIAVVAHHNEAALELGKVVLQDLQRDDVEVVGGLVEDEEVGGSHQHRAEVESAFLASAELAHVVVLLLGFEEEMLQELTHGKSLPIAHIDHFGYVAHHVNHLGIVAELYAVLTVVAEAHRLAYVEMSLVGCQLAQQELDEGGFARAVIACDAHLLIAGETVVEVFQNGFLSECFRHVLCHEYLRADVSVAHFQAHLLLVDSALCHFLQLVESLFAIACLVASCLWHASHPFQLRAVEVVSPHDFLPRLVQPFLPLLQVVGVVALVAVDGGIVHFDDGVAHAVEEVAVVCHHEQAGSGAAQVGFQPFNHLHVEVVGRLVEDEQVGFVLQHASQCHSLHHASRQLLHLLAHVGDFQLGENLLGAEFVGMSQADVAHGEFSVVGGSLLQIAHFQAVSENHLPAFVAFDSSDDAEQRGFSCAVLGNESDALALAYGEGDVVEKDSVADALRQPHHFEVWIYLCHVLR